MNNRSRVLDVVTKSMNVAHRVVWKLSGHRLLNSPMGMPAVELHTTGRRSGQRRTVILTTPIHDADRVVLVASKGGDDRHPDWYRNLSDDPQVELTIDGVTRAYVARTASASEKAEMWPRVVEAYKGYASYQRRTSRDIPLVVCEPAAPADR
ncbi:MAG: nitroreductase family deazaflavin-dependent oxidoreductase [Microthrixaceae bacterium]